MTPAVGPLVVLPAVVGPREELQVVAGPLGDPQAVAGPLEAPQVAAGPLRAVAAAGNCDKTPHSHPFSLTSSHVHPLLCPIPPYCLNKNFSV